MQEITITELAPRFESGEAPLVDVREADEWAQQHVDGAVHIPMSEFMQREHELPEGEPLYIICHSGGRSANVAQYLEQKGISAVNVAGGITAWQREGLPIVSD